jgi:hypothetical protein
VTAVTVDLPVDVRRIWRRWRFPLVVGVLFVSLAVVLAAIENAPPSRPLDPTDPSSQGGRALAQLVRDRGVEVQPVRNVGGSPMARGTTVFVPDPTSLTQGDLTYLSLQAATVVVVAPGRRELRALGIAASPVSSSGADTRISADCTFGPARVAGRVHYQGADYAAPAAAATCYARGRSSGLFVATSNSARIIVFGSPRTFTNDWIDDEGDAALGLGLLSASPRLEWVVPRPPTAAPADRQQRGLTELLPHRLLWATFQLFVAVLLLALWRARRVGPVVAEPLLVVVRATETVEGRARLLRAARARGAAADALRAATLARLRDRLGLAADVTRPEAVEPVARRSGWASAEVDRVLYGPQPADDPALIRLSNELDQLDRTVRRSS